MPTRNAKPFLFNEIVSMPEHYNLLFYTIRGRPFFCVGHDAIALIKGVARQRSSSVWKEYEDGWQRVKPILGVWRTECGWFASRGDMWKLKVLSHRLNDLPLLFPTPDIAKMAAERCCPPRANPALGWMGWIAPVNP
jgi:hypothetical protein